jgi:hypothetical protein
MCNLACRLEPCLRCEPAAEQQNGFARQARNLEQRAPAQAVALRQCRQKRHWIEGARIEADITRRHDGYFNLTAIEHISQQGPAGLLQLDLNQRVSTLIACQEICQETLDHLGCCADAQQARLSGFHGSRALAQCAGFCQETAAMSQKVLTLRGQPDTASYPIEQRDSQLQLKAVDLPRKGGLAQMQALSGASKPTRIHDGREGTKVAKVHSPMIMNLHQTTTNNCIGRILRSSFTLLRTSRAASSAPSRQRKEPAMRSRLLLKSITLVIALSVGAVAKADIATEWNVIAVEATAIPPNSILQSRVLAITHVAMYDAARIINQKPPLLAAGIRLDSPASLEAAVSAAAQTVLKRLAPAQSAVIDTRYQSMLSGVADGPEKTNGMKLGQLVAEKVLELRAKDGATQKAATTLKDGPGFYQLTPPHSMPPILAQWGAVEPFVIRLRDGYETKGPPKVDSAEFKADFDEVKLLGARDSRVRTADQTAAAVFWTVQTGVPWFAAARAAAADRKGTLMENLRLFALLSVAVADSQIACFKDKYNRLHWRPITAIRAAATLKMPTLQGDADWEPLLGTPPHPEYPSAHACYSGAAEAILRGELKTDNVRVSVTFPPVFGVTRTYMSFSGISKEVNDARVWGGIHFRSADLDGHDLGWRVGEAVLRDFDASGSH